MYRYKNINFPNENFCNLGIDYIQATKNSDEDLPNLELIYLQKLNSIETKTNIELWKFINKFSHIEYKIKINLFNSFEYIASYLKNTSLIREAQIEEILINFLSKSSKLIKLEINFIKVNEFLIPFDNLLLFSLYSLFVSIKQWKEIYEYLNSINNEIINKKTIEKITEYFDDCEIDFFIYENQEEINNNLVEPQFLKSKNNFYLPFGTFSNTFSKMLEKYNLKSISEIEKYITENKNKSYLLSIESNPKEIYKIVQNNSFVEHILSENTIITTKKYLFNKNYWTKLFSILINYLPFEIPEKEKELEILYDDKKFRVVKINSKIINFNNHFNFVITKLINEKSLNSRTYHISRIQEEMILSNIIDIKLLFAKYKFNKNKLKYCSGKILNIIKGIDNSYDSEINFEITNKKITGELTEVNDLIKNKTNFFEESLIIIKNNGIDIFSTARSIRSFIELISKLFIVDQMFKCFNDTEKKKYNSKIYKLSKKLNLNLSINLLKICINPNLSSLSSEISDLIKKDKTEFDILHLKYHLDKFNDKFSFPENSFGFDEDVYVNFIKKLINLFDKNTLNIFAHSFYWFHNDDEIQKLSTNLIDSIKGLIKLSETEYYNDFITQLNSIYDFLSNKDKSLEKFFNTAK